MKRKIAFIIFCLIFLAGLIYYQVESRPVDRNNKGVQAFVINKGEGLKVVTDNLAREGLIRNKVVFYLVLKKLGIEKKIQAGEFRLSKNMSAEEIATGLTHGTQDAWITVIEGLRKEEVAQVVAQSIPIDPNDFIKQAREGMLFPDTYLIPRTATSADIISIMEKNFETKYSADLKQQVVSKGITERQGIIVASMVEREAQFPEDKKIVAGIIIKRYKNDWPMDIDATIQYALGYQPKTKTWWKKDLTIDDIAVDNTYNTYKYPGLPPGPISNPGLDSLTGVAEAEINTPYWYYITDKKGVMHYAKTLEEHNENIRNYLQ